MSGFIELERANVRWFLSVDEKDLPVPIEPGQPKVYEEILAGEGFEIEDARPSIELTYRIRTTPLVPKDDLIHPLMEN